MILSEAIGGQQKKQSNKQTTLPFQVWDTSIKEKSRFHWPGSFFPGD